MKTTTHFIVLVALVSLVSCKDQINTPTTASEKIVYTTVDNSNSLVIPHVIAADSSGITTQDLGAGFLFHAGNTLLLWGSGTSEDSSELLITDRSGNSRTVLKNLLGPKEEFYLTCVISPDGSKIIYGVADTSDMSMHLYLANSDGTSKIELTNRWGHETRFCFSPDSKQVAYYRTEGNGASMHTILEIASVTGGSRVKVTDVEDTYNDGNSSIAWSAKNILAYQDNGAIYTINLDGSNKQKISDGYCPSWSPTGDTLAYAFDDIMLTWDNGATKMNLTNSNGISEGFPNWSGDGKRLLVTRWLGNRIEDAVLSLQEYNLTTGTDKLIASPGAYGYYVK